MSARASINKLDRIRFFFLPSSRLLVLFVIYRDGILYIGGYLDDPIWYKEKRFTIIGYSDLSRCAGGRLALRSCCIFDPTGYSLMGKKKETFWACCVVDLCAPAKKKEERPRNDDRGELRAVAAAETTRLEQNELAYISYKERKKKKRDKIPPSLSVFFFIYSIDPGWIPWCLYSVLLWSYNYLKCFYQLFNSLNFVFVLILLWNDFWATEKQSSLLGNFKFQSWDLAEIEMIHLAG